MGLSGSISSTPPWCLHDDMNILQMGYGRGSAKLLVEKVVGINGMHFDMMIGLGIQTVNNKILICGRRVADNFLQLLDWNGHLTIPSSQPPPPPSAFLPQAQFNFSVKRQRSKCRHLSLFILSLLVVISTLWFQLENKIEIGYLKWKH